METREESLEHAEEALMAATEHGSPEGRTHSDIIQVAPEPGK